MVCLQDCHCCLGGSATIHPSLAESFEFRTDMDLSGGGLLWCSQPQLFFQCTVCPTGSLRLPRQHKELVLVFFSTLETITKCGHAEQWSAHILRYCQQL